MSAVIYKATNTVNGKPYIGYDSAWPLRQSQHLQVAFNQKQQSYHSIFHRAIRKYGPNAFTWEILFRSNNSTHTLNSMEPHFIREHNTHYLSGHGYNMTYGGEGRSGPMTDRAKRNNSFAQLGKILTVEHRHNISLGCRDFGNRIAKDWVMTSPKGIESVIRNLRRFCIDHNLDQGNMMKVAKGKCAHCKGWKCRPHTRI